MKPKHQRFVFLTVSLVFLCVATLLALQAFRENVVFFYTPADLAEKQIGPQQKIRLGGLVEEGSVRREGDEDLFFTVTDGAASIAVTYKGIPPGLFREGQGVVVEGTVEANTLTASRLLTKHDEYYMPREVADALKKSGRWQGEMQ